MKKHSLSLFTCRAETTCKYAAEDCDNIKNKLQALFNDHEFPAKIKIGISGCARCCAMPKIRDLGIIATHHGWELHFGGNGGYSPRIAEFLADHLTSEQLLHHISVVLELYSLNANQRERSARFIERFGVKNFVNLYKSSL